MIHLSTVRSCFKYYNVLNFNFCSYQIINCNKGLSFVLTLDGTLLVDNVWASSYEQSEWWGWFETIDMRLLYQWVMFFCMKYLWECVTTYWWNSIYFSQCPSLLENGAYKRFSHWWDNLMEGEWKQAMWNQFHAWSDAQQRRLQKINLSWTVQQPTLNSSSYKSTRSLAQSEAAQRRQRQAMHAIEHCRIRRWRLQTRHSAVAVRARKHAPSQANRRHWLRQVDR